MEEKKVDLLTGDASAEMGVVSNILDVKSVEVPIPRLGDVVYVNLFDGEDDDDSDYDADEMPFDPSEIDIDTKEITVFSLLERIKNKEIVLDTDYQRNPSLWNKFRKSQLIESMLLGIPIPPFYFAIDRDYRNELGLMRQSWQVVDGLQRLCVIQEFMAGERVGNSPRNFLDKLDGMQYLKSLNGKKYADLPEALKRTLLEVNIKANVIRKSTPIEVKLNIFRRLNTGGMPLSMQEIRHAMHSKGSAWLLKKWAQMSEFKSATQNAISWRRMGDREYVNRFLAFYLLGVDAYRGMDVFLEQSLSTIDKWEGQERLQAEPDCLQNDERVKAIEANFTEALTTIHDVFEDVAYCKVDISQQHATNRRRLNKALFEVFTVCVARMSREARKQLDISKEIARAEYGKLFEDRSENGLDDLVSVSTGRKRRVIKRYEIVSDFLKRMTGEAIEWRKGLYD